MLGYFQRPSFNRIFSRFWVFLDCMVRPFPTSFHNQKSFTSPFIHCRIHSRVLPLYDTYLLAYTHNE